MNKAIIMGRLTRDPQVKYFEKDGQQFPVATYTLAVDRQFKGNEGNADFIPCKAYGKNADFASNYLKQGVKMCIEGHITTGNYTNKDGQKIYFVEVTVDRQEFCESKTNSTGGNTYPSDDLPKINESAAQPSGVPTPPTAPNNNFMDIPSDIGAELPFR